MIGTMILAGALMGQARAQASSPRAEEKATAARELVARRRGRKADAYAATRRREAAEAKAAAEAEAAAKAEYMRMLPYALENQRQILDYQARMQQNRLLERGVSAMERAAAQASADAWLYGRRPLYGPTAR